MPKSKFGACPARAFHSSQRAQRQVALQAAVSCLGQTDRQGLLVTGGLIAADGTAKIPTASTAVMRAALLFWVVASCCLSGVAYPITPLACSAPCVKHASTCLHYSASERPATPHILSLPDLLLNPCPIPHFSLSVFPTSLALSASLLSLHLPPLSPLPLPVVLASSLKACRAACSLSALWSLHQALLCLFTLGVTGAYICIGTLLCV